MEDNKELVTNVTENVEEQATEELVDGAKAQTTEENVNAVDEATANEESELAKHCQFRLFLYNQPASSDSALR